MTDLAPDAPAPNRARIFLRDLLKRRMVAIGLAILIVFVLLAALAPLLAPYAPGRLSVVNRLKPPSAGTSSRACSMRADCRFRLALPLSCCPR